MITQLVALFAGLLSQSVAEPFVVSSGDSVHSEYRVVSASSFTPEYLKHAANLFVKANAKKKFAQLYVVTDQKHIQILLGTGASETDLQWMLELRRKYKRFPVARVVSRGRDAVIETRDGSGTYKQVILSGTNPLELVHAGTSYRVVWALIAPAGEEKRSAPGQKMSAGLFVVSERIPDASAGLLLWRYISTEFGLQNISFTVRQRPFFVSETFPVDFPFTPVPHVPDSEEAYLREASLNCHLDGSRISCSTSIGGKAHADLR